MSIRIASGKVRLSEAMAVSTILICVEREFKEAGYDVFITSGIDGVHKRGSLHTDDPERDDKPAVDFRTKNVPKSIMIVVYKRIKLYLSPAFDVLWEDVGKANEHLHVEYDPD